MAKALDEAAIEWEQVGYKSGGPTREPERLMGDADIVIGKARVIVEAMSSGRAAYVYDHNGGDGWVTSERYALLEADNSGGQAEPAAADLERIRPTWGLSAGDGRCEPSARGRQPQREQARAGARAPLPAPQSASAARRRAAPRARAAGPVQTDIHRRAHTLSVEAQQARELEHSVRVELAAAQARLAELEPQAEHVGLLESKVQALQKQLTEVNAAGCEALEREQSLLAQRRVRLGLALARPLDRARRLFR